MEYHTFAHIFFHLGTLSRNLSLFTPNISYSYSYKNLRDFSSQDLTWKNQATEKHFVSYRRKFEERCIQYHLPLTLDRLLFMESNHKILPSPLVRFY